VYLITAVRSTVPINGTDRLIRMVDPGAFHLLNAAYYSIVRAVQRPAIREAHKMKDGRTHLTPRPRTRLDWRPERLWPRAARLRCARPRNDSEDTALARHSAGSNWNGEICLFFGGHSCVPAVCQLIQDRRAEIKFTYNRSLQTTEIVVTHGTRRRDRPRLKSSEETLNQ
jgi:hypothetical protein